MIKTCGIIIIGDEILSGKVRESNAYYITQNCRNYGIDVKRILIISDIIDEIGAAVKDFSQRFDYVFTSGGIGPTHDDVTIAGISSAFNVKPVINELLKDVITQKMGDRTTPEALKMAEIPEGAILITDETLTFPLIQFKNIYIFPGVPDYMRMKFDVLKKTFSGPPFILKKVFVNQFESEFASILNEVVSRHKQIKIGSYPTINNEEYRVMLTLESIDINELNASLIDLKVSLTDRRIVKIIE
ncbi:MAG: competence/damage-inducible protein A [Nitrospirae bacterium]|nr:competence/damage-inducible protein A [Nitrospirota bacterium]